MVLLEAEVVLKAVALTVLKPKEIHAQVSSPASPRSQTYGNEHKKVMSAAGGERKARSGINLPGNVLEPLDGSTLAEKAQKDTQENVVSPPPPVCCWSPFLECLRRRGGLEGCNVE